MKQLQNLKEVFINQLERATLVYKTVGMSDRESPMWFQLNTLENDEDNSLLFKSSLSDVWMRIPCTKEQKKFVNSHYQDSYDYFKRLKYTHLRDNHPTVWYEIGEVPVRRVEAFLRTEEKKGEIEKELERERRKRIEEFGVNVEWKRFSVGKPVVKQSSLRKNIPLVLAIVMFVLTTALVVLIPKALVYRLDTLQWAILAIIMFMGYGGGSLYLMAHLTPEDNLIDKKEQKYK